MGLGRNIKLFKISEIMNFHLIKDSLSKTFHYKDLIIETHPEVYDPAEDTFLLLDAIEIKKDDYVLEIGTGCGIIALECARIGANVICTDINPFAIELVKKNYLMNQNILTGNFEVRIGDLFSPILSSERFDKIIFNPPYLSTKKEDLTKGSGWFDVATNGGEDGFLVTKRFLDKLDIFMNKNGSAYFVFSSLSNKEKLEKIIDKNGFNFEIVKRCTFNDEELVVYCICKKEK